jgi:hypothetical protein
MYGSIRNSGIEHINDYASALERWGESEPIRRRAVDTRPLGFRNRVDSYRINKLPDGAVECILHKTPVVTFYENGEVRIQTGGWASQSTCSFIQEVLHIHCYIFNYKLCVGFDYKHYVVPSGGMTIKRNAKWVYEPVNPEPVVVHNLNRKGANNVRATYKPFKTYLSSMCKLKGDSLYSAETYCQVFGEDKYGNPKVADLGDGNYDRWTNDIKEFFKLVNDTNKETQNESFYKALLIVAKSFGDGWVVNDTEGYSLSEKKALKSFDDLVLGFHRAETLEDKVLPDGEVKQDPYMKYFRGGWKRLHNR